MKRRGFTLLELLMVIGIMGLMGSITVGGYRAMRRGMEERSVFQNVNQFVRAAYQRAQIDRQPVCVYFWNETLRPANNDEGEPAIAVGKAVAVRRAGRLSFRQGQLLYDEFGDLSADEDGSDENGSDEESSGKGGVYMYCLNGNESSMQRSTVEEIPVSVTVDAPFAQSGGTRKSIQFYAHRLAKTSGSSYTGWKTGDAYGFEFAEIQLPHGYLFGKKYDANTAGPMAASESSMRFRVGDNSGSGAQNGKVGDDVIEIFSLRPNSSGRIEAQSIGKSESPTKQGS